MSCYRHTYVSARFQCPNCKALWCPDCVERPEYDHATSTICPGCKGLLRACAPTQVPSNLYQEDPQQVFDDSPRPEGSFQGDLGRAFLFPLRPRVFVTMLIFCSVFFFSPMCVRSLPLLGLWMICVTATFGLMGNYLGDIIVSIALGDEELPQLQMFENFVIDGIFAGCRYLSLIALCFGAQLSFIYYDEASMGTFVVLGTSFFFPLLWLGAALTRSFAGSFHPELFRMLRTIALPYVTTYLCMVIGLSICYALFSKLYAQEEGFAYIGVFPLAGYFLFVMSFMLGKLVYHHQDEFEDAGLI